jgi:lipopolysaccharide/colanic/teichoic acid biosynthesis glycosyltransferase
MKRAFDIFFSIFGLFLSIPALFFIILLVKLNDKGSVFFKQVRIGLNGKQFILYKFRSMSELKYDQIGRFEPGNTSRVTSIGKFIRRTKLDELPQLFNVLKGDMSVVGPRPEVEKWVAAYPERWKKILSVKPGITDNAAIIYSQEEILLANSEDPEKTYKENILPNKLDIYENYVMYHSFFGDIKLIFKTFMCIIQKNK